MYKIHTTCNVLPAFIDSDTYSTDTLNNIYLECIRNRQYVLPGDPTQIVNTSGQFGLYNRKILMHNFPIPKSIHIKRLNLYWGI